MAVVSLCPTGNWITENLIRQLVKMVFFFFFAGAYYEKTRNIYMQQSRLLSISLSLLIGFLKWNEFKVKSSQLFSSVLILNSIQLLFISIIRRHAVVFDTRSGLIGRTDLMHAGLNLHSWNTCCLFRIVYAWMRKRERETCVVLITWI